MKQKISISIDEDKMNKIQELLKGSRFRSKSHIIEFSLEKFLMEEASDSILANPVDKKQNGITRNKNG